MSIRARSGSSTPASATLVYYLVNACRMQSWGPVFEASILQERAKLSGDEPIEVLILHENLLASELLANEFSRRDGFRASRASSVANATRQLQRRPADVVLISSTLEGAGLSEVERLNALFPQTKAVLLVREPDAGTIMAAFRHGARGVFHSPQSDVDALLKCVRCVQAGQVWASTAELDMVMSALQNPVRYQPETKGLLTIRETDVVRLLAAGMTNRDIARELRLSEHTVKNYMFRIFDKVGVSSRVELLLYAVHHLPAEIASSKVTAYPDHAEPEYALAS